VERALDDADYKRRARWSRRSEAEQHGTGQSDERGTGWSTRRGFRAITHDDEEGERATRK
jgi:hypothetical protein